MSAAARVQAEAVVVDAAARFGVPAAPAAELGPVDDRRGADRGDDSNRRRSPRRRVLIAGLLDTPAGSLEVKLRNVSSTGALLETAAPPAMHSRVTFRRGTMIVPGQVVWVRAGACGIHFDSPIDEAQLMIPIGKSSPAR